VLVLLDLSSAFDTVDYNILLDRLENWIGLSGIVIKWFRSFLEGRGYYVSIGDHKSEWTSMTCPSRPNSCATPTQPVYAPTEPNSEKEPNCLPQLCR